jgi:hypothetical protein
LTQLIKDVQVSTEGLFPRLYTTGIKSRDSAVNIKVVL